MKTTLFAVLMVLVLGSMVFAQSPAQTDDPIQSNAYYPDDPTFGNSAVVFIKITMAGEIFELSNGEWVIGDNTEGWFCFPQNIYHSAAGSHSGAGSLLPAWTGYVPTTPASPGYTDVFDQTTAGDNGDCPVIYNQGGIALDFFLTISPNIGFDFHYESAHSSNVMNDEVTSGVAFKDGVQLRAIFLRHTLAANATGQFTDADYAKFCYSNPVAGWGSDAYGSPTPNPPTSHARYSDLVLTSKFFRVADASAITASFGFQGVLTNPDGAQMNSWAEATSYRFTAARGGAPPNDFTNYAPFHASVKGLGVLPGERVTIAMQFLSPKLISSTYETQIRSLADRQAMLRMRVTGCPSDAF